MTDSEYTVIVKGDSKAGHWTQEPALPGCGSQGDTVEKALENTKEAIRAYLGSLRKHGEPMPEDTTVVVKVTVAA